MSCALSQLIVELGPNLIGNRVLYKYVKALHRGSQPPVCMFNVLTTLIFFFILFVFLCFSVLQTDSLALTHFQVLLALTEFMNGYKLLHNYNDSQ